MKECKGHVYICISARLNPRGTTENNELVTARKTKPNIKHDLSDWSRFLSVQLKGYSYDVRS